MKVDCKVASRFAHTVMTTVAMNKGNSSKEMFFEVDLPKTAFITNFSMLVTLLVKSPHLIIEYIMFDVDLCK